MNEYIKSLEQEFSLIKSGFKKEENPIKAPETPTAPTTSTIESDDYVLDWPLKGSHVITAGYKYSSGSAHNAIDLRVDYKQPVYAAGDGIVNFTYTWNGKITSGDTNSYGNCFKSNCRYGYWYFYRFIFRKKQRNRK